MIYCEQCRMWCNCHDTSMSCSYISYLSIQLDNTWASNITISQFCSDCGVLVHKTLMLQGAHQPIIFILLQHSEVTKWRIRGQATDQDMLYVSCMAYWPHTVYYHNYTYIGPASIILSIIGSLFWWELCWHIFALECEKWGNFFSLWKFNALDAYGYRQLATEC